MGLNRVLFRSIGNQIQKGTSKIMGCEVPRGTTSFDYITASGKRNFKVLTFRDEQGNSLMKKIDFLNGAGTKTRIIYNKTNGGTSIINLSDKGNSICDRTMIPSENNNIYMLQNNINKNRPDRHSLFALEQGKQRKGITYETNWDGNKPNIEYINMDKRLSDTKDIEYLPLSVEYADPFRKKQRIAHISSIQEKQLKLEGLVPKPKVVNELEVMAGANYKCMGDTDLYTGQIRISNQINGDSATLLRILGHEYRHLKDFFNIHRIKFDTNMTPEEISKMENEIEKLYPGAIKFDKTAESKGFLKKNSQMERKYTKIKDEFVRALTGEEYSASEEAHDSFSFERRANVSAKKEVNKLWDIANRIQNFILNA